MISKHVQDPIKAWRRERHRWQVLSEPTKIMTFSQTAAAFPALNVALHPRVECLHNLKATDLTANKNFLLVVSSTGKGEVPPNGSAFFASRAYHPLKQ